MRVTDTGGVPLEACNKVTVVFGDGATTTLTDGPFEVVHSYPARGKYYVTASAVNDFGYNSDGRLVYVAKGTVSLVARSIVAPEGASIDLAIQRTSSAGSVVVAYATVDGTAEAGVDYVATSGTLTFSPGEVEKTIPVHLLSDSNYRTGRDFVFRLSTSDPDYFTDVENEKITIADDDQPHIAFGEATYVVRENAGHLDLAVVRKDGDQIMPINGNVGLACPGLLTAYSPVRFAAGESTTRTSVEVEDNTTYDGVQKCALYMYSQDAVPGPDAVLYVEDDEEVPTLTFGTLTAPEGDTDHSLSMKATLFPPLRDGLHSQAVIRNSSGLKPAGLSAHLSDFRWLTEGTVEIGIGGNTIPGKDETYAVTLARDEPLKYCCAPGPGTPAQVLMRIKPGSLTIINDDYSMVPGELRLRKGRDGYMSVAFGHSLSEPALIQLKSSNPEVAVVPDTFVLPAEFNPSFPVSAVGAGHSTITGVLPAALGGGTLAAFVVVYTGVDLMVDPQRLAIPLQSSARLRISAKPPGSAPLAVRIAPAINGIVTVAGNAVIPPGSFVDVPVDGEKLGTTAITLTLPPENGVETTTVLADVVPADSFAVTWLSPASGIEAGGTAVAIFGGGFQPSCSVTFGGVPAQDVSVTGTTMLTARTPAHSAGAVDVAVTCESATGVLPAAFTFVPAAGSRPRPSRP